MNTADTAERIVTMKNGRTKRFRSKVERRQIVEETFRPGVSVALVARAHDVNANQVFEWRRHYREGRLELDHEANTLLPVKISRAVQQHRRAAQRKAHPAPAGIIEIELGHARVRIEGAADPDCVRATLEGLSR